MAAAIEVDGVWEGYRPKTAMGFRRLSQVHWALRDVSFDVSPGEIVAVLGSNGSGKTTLLQTVSGVLRPSRGDIRTAGRVSSLVDATGFHYELTGHENVLIGGQLLGLDRSELNDILPDVAAFAELPREAWEAPIRTYSAGMWLRLGLSLVLHARPGVLLLDEVLAVGDERFQTRAWARVQELCADGCGVLIVTHRLEQVGRYCHRAIVLDQGKMAFQGPADESLEFYVATGGKEQESRWWETYGGHQWRRRRVARSQRH